MFEKLHLLVASVFFFSLQRLDYFDYSDDISNDAFESTHILSSYCFALDLSLFVLEVIFSDTGEDSFNNEFSSLVLHLNFIDCQYCNDLQKKDFTS
jgi:hypothetical protein